jgi:tRNA-dihydrouridine synthase
MQSFWNGLTRPFFVLAPMADVTDAAYRALIARTGKPDLMFTEFVSADGLFHTREIKKLPDRENSINARSHIQPGGASHRGAVLHFKS